MEDDSRLLEQSTFSPDKRHHASQTAHRSKNRPGSAMIYGSAMRFRVKANRINVQGRCHELFKRLWGTAGSNKKNKELKLFAASGG